MAGKKHIEKAFKGQKLVPILIIATILISTGIIFTYSPSEPELIQAEITDYSFNNKQVTVRLKQDRGNLTRYQVYSPALDNKEIVRLNPGEMKEVTLQGENTSSLKEITVEIKPIEKDIASKQPYTLRVNKEVI